MESTAPDFSSILRYLSDSLTGRLVLALGRLDLAPALVLLLDLEGDTGVVPPFSLALGDLFDLGILLLVHVVQEDLLELEAPLCIEALDLVATINSS